MKEFCKIFCETIVVAVFAPMIGLLTVIITVIGAFRLIEWIV